MSKEIKYSTNEDFGFSFIDDEISDLKKQVKSNTNDFSKVSEENEILKNNMKELFELTNKFLENLKKNPEKKTIYWPNRAEKIEEFQEKLKQIVG
jgi:DNA repair exonuclease SbcCD ATPase subunit